MITFVTINCDDKQREWDFDSVDELSKAYWTTCDIPSLDDPIVSCEFMGIPLRLNCPRSVRQLQMVNGTWYGRSSHPYF